MAAYSPTYNPVPPADGPQTPDYTPHTPVYTPHSPDYMPHSPPADAPYGRPRNAMEAGAMSLWPTLFNGSDPNRHREEPPIKLAPVPEKAKRRAADAKARKQQETGPGQPRDERPIVYSIVIPRVFKNIGEKRIRAIIYKLNFGFLQRVDIVPKRGKEFNVVFLHFSQWNTSPTANAIRSRLDEGQQVKVVYEDPWYWLIKKSEATLPEDRPKKRPAPFIDFYHKPTAEPKTTAEPKPTQKSVTFEESTCRGGAAYGKKSYTIRMQLEAIERDAEATEALYVKDPASESGFRIRTQSGKTVHTFADYVKEHKHLLKKEFSSWSEASSLWSEIDVLVDNEWVPGNRFFTLAQPSTDAPMMPFPGTPSPETDEELAARLRYEEEERDAEEEFRRKKEMNALGI